MTGVTKMGIDLEREARLLAHLETAYARLDALLYLLEFRARGGMNLTEDELRYCRGVTDAMSAIRSAIDEV